MKSTNHDPLHIIQKIFLHGAQKQTKFSHVTYTRDLAKKKKSLDLTVEVEQNIE